MAQRTTQPPAAEDGFELRNDGKCRLTVDGKTVTLRRPKLGQFRKIREALHDRDDESLRILTEGNAELVEIGEPAGDADPVAAAAVTMRRREVARRMSDQVVEVNVAWVASSLALLADGDIPEADEWPEGMETEAFIQGLVTHWRTVPLDHGGA